MRFWLRRIVALGLVSAVLSIAAGFLGFLHPAFDTFAHLRFHISFALVLVAVVVVGTSQRRMALLALPIALLGMVSTWQGHRLFAETAVPLEGRPQYFLLHLNLLWNHSDPEPVVDWLLETDPDLISLAEASWRWENQLLKLLPRYPHLHNCPEYGKRGGVRIYSKWPIKKGSTYCATYGVYGTARIELPGSAPVTIGSIHLRWPWPASGPRQLEGIVPELRRLEADALIAGDFNATTWSYALRRFAEAGDLKIVSGIGPTWIFEELPAIVGEWIGFPIDNALSKGKVHILNATRLPSVGSDHFPVSVRFQVE